MMLFYLSAVLFSDSEEIKEMVCELEERSKIRRLSMNIGKTAMICSNNEEIEIMIDGKKIVKVDEVVYLGQNISMGNRTADEVERRIALAWKKFWLLKSVFKGKITISNKTKILNSCVLPTLKYGSQTWATNKNDERKIKVMQNSMERSMMGIRLRDRISLNTIRNRIKNRIDSLHDIKRQKWDWAGHVSRQNEKRWTYCSKNWFLKTGRKKGKQKTRWDDDIVKFLGNRLYHRVAHDRREWLRLREAYARSRA